MDLIKIRRDLHKYPELGYMEFRTASKVIDFLKSWGYEVLYGEDAVKASARRGLPAEEEIDAAYTRALKDGANPKYLERMKGGLTGVVGIKRGKQSGPTVAFRFDMDALPITESDQETHRPKQEGFRSHYEGNMHACAHDAHTAIGIGLAEKLASLDFAGTVKLIFQPAEEGSRGAYAMMKKGVVDDVDRIYCFHLGLEVPLGEMYGGSTGWLATTKLETHFHGVPSHTGMFPEKGRNALLGAATALMNIHSLPRYSDGSTRVGVGVLEGGTAPNVTPYFAKMISETRASSAEINEDMEKRMKTIIKNAAAMHELEEEIYVIGKGTTIDCDKELVQIAMEEAEKIEAFTSCKKCFKANVGEDASLLIERVQDRGGKGTYMVIGTTISAPHHHQDFEIDERVLPWTVELLHRIAKRELKA